LIGWSYITFGGDGPGPGNPQCSGIGNGSGGGPPGTFCVPTGLIDSGRPRDID